MNKKILIIFIIVIIAIFAILFFINQKDAKEGSPNLVAITSQKEVKSGEDFLTDYLKNKYGNNEEIMFDYVDKGWIKGTVGDIVFYAKYFSDGWQTIYEGPEKDIPCEEFKKYNMPYSMLDMCYIK